MDHALLDRPKPSWGETIPVVGLAYFTEVTCYVGPIAVALGPASLTRGWRWWHAPALICGWLAVGSMHRTDASLWLSYWPVLGTEALPGRRAL